MGRNAVAMFDRVPSMTYTKVRISTALELRKCLQMRSIQLCPRLQVTNWTRGQTWEPRPSLCCPGQPGLWAGTPQHPLDPPSCSRAPPLLRQRLCRGASLPAPLDACPCASSALGVEPASVSIASRCKDRRSHSKLEVGGSLMQLNEQGSQCRLTDAQELMPKCFTSNCSRRQQIL